MLSQHDEETYKRWFDTQKIRCQVFFILLHRFVRSFKKLPGGQIFLGFIFFVLIFFTGFILLNRLVSGL